MRSQTFFALTIATANTFYHAIIRDGWLSGIIVYLRVEIQWRSQYGANGAAAPPELPKVTPPICPDPLSFFQVVVGGGGGV